MKNIKLLAIAFLLALSTQAQTNSFNENNNSSGEKSVVNKEENKIDFDFNIYPNPTSGQINLDFQTENHSDAQATLRVFNSSGREIVTRSLAGLNAMSLDLSFLPKNIYFVIIERGNVRLTKKVVLV